MFKEILNNFFYNNNDYILKKFNKIVSYINSIESDFEKLNNKQLREKTVYFKKLLHNGENLDHILPEAYATVREASKRVFGMRHFDVQILGGIVLHKNCIAEMQTGEGKTLTSTLPAYLNALSNKGVHIVTMNDYLAKRDAKKNKPLFEFLGLKVGLNLSNMSIEEKRKAYSADITYATNNEYGFDYLKDNMVFSKKDKVQRSLNYAIIDEVDSILIDEARTPLIISGSLNNNNFFYKKINKFIIPKLILQGYENEKVINFFGDFIINKKYKQLYLTELGFKKIERLLIKYNFISNKYLLYSNSNIFLFSCILSLLRAHYLYFKNVDYIVKKKKIIIVDEHTGRIAIGRRWSDGLHQSIEAKENVDIKNENKLLASITFQNYFLLYKKLCGMTGTAETEFYEFLFVYNLNTVIIPTNLPMIRKDMPDLVYLTKKEKFNAIIFAILSCVKIKQPVLVGTISIEQSEIISKKLKILGIKHNVLNAKFHDKEADIISQAGKIGAVTIATNIAGRGIDIILGGCKKKKKNKNNCSCFIKKWDKKNKFVLNVGGLHVIGTERHESRRIDNQLRGRSGRQGDVGSSQFYLSLEDSLMKIFISNKMKFFFRNLGINFGEFITHPWINKIIEKAQNKIEQKNFDLRKQLLDYDNIYNKQRIVIYKYRNFLLKSKNINDIINKILHDVINSIINKFFNKYIYKKKKNILNFKKYLKKNFNIVFLNIQTYNFKIFKKKLFKNIFINANLNLFYKEKIIGLKNIKRIKKFFIIKILDDFWTDHLINMENLRQNINLRSYAQKDPKQEYIKESFYMFTSMLKTFKYELISFLIKTDVSFLKSDNFFYNR
ncbi:preprotein translocase subunit SecA [Buchnera aphidicola]|uniref:preprotein translocase subunit SecA n=1 Tax=Buchnera aphidicola TaxID=9 RepID=UPI0031B87799